MKVRSRNRVNFPDFDANFNDKAEPLSPVGQKVIVLSALPFDWNYPLGLDDGKKTNKETFFFKKTLDTFEISPILTA